ncbi:hypothetical protein EBT23_04270 [bacterium]|nr:hypothetical protein [bacterium]
MRIHPILGVVWALGVGGGGAGWAELPLPPPSQSQPALEKPGRLPESVATYLEPSVVSRESARAQPR